MSFEWKAGGQTFASPPDSHGEQVRGVHEALAEILAVLQRIEANIAQSSDSRSSVEIKTSARGVDIAAKSYAGSDVSLQVMPAAAAYYDALAEVERRKA